MLTSPLSLHFVNSMSAFPNIRLRAEKIQPENVRHVNTRMLLALGFKEFLGLYEYPLDGR